MAEASEEYLARKMTRSDLNELTVEERTERRRLQNCINRKKYRENHPKKVAEQNKKYKDEHKEQSSETNKKYYEANKEKIAEYRQSPNGKKVHTLSSWKSRGLQESKEDLDRIYELYLHQELCNACDCILTRDGDRSSTDASMDHDHDTHRFRHIICNSCNNHDRWKQYFC